MTPVAIPRHPLTLPDIRSIAAHYANALRHFRRIIASSAEIRADVQKYNRGRIINIQLTVGKTACQLQSLSRTKIVVHSLIIT